MRRRTDMSVNWWGCFRPKSPGTSVVGEATPSTVDTQGLQDVAPRPSSTASAVPTWEEHLAGTLPFSVAILSSDAQQVLHQSPGADPLAAKLLHNTLKIRARRLAESDEPVSVLSSLLGPELEVKTLEALAQQRPWKSTVISSLSDQIPHASKSLEDLAQSISRFGAPLGHAGKHDNSQPLISHSRATLPSHAPSGSAGPVGSTACGTPTSTDTPVGQGGLAKALAFESQLANSSAAAPAPARVAAQEQAGGGGAAAAPAPAPAHVAAAQEQHAGGSEQSTRKPTEQACSDSTRARIEEVQGKQESTSGTRALQKMISNKSVRWEREEKSDLQHPSSPSSREPSDSAAVKEEGPSLQALQQHSAPSPQPHGATALSRLHTKRSHEVVVEHTSPQGTMQRSKTYGSFKQRGSCLLSMSEEEVERLLTGPGTGDDCRRSATFLRGLSRARTPSRQSSGKTAASGPSHKSSASDQSCLPRSSRGDGSIEEAGGPHITDNMATGRSKGEDMVKVLEASPSNTQADSRMDSAFWGTHAFSSSNLEHKGNTEQEGSLHTGLPKSFTPQPYLMSLIEGSEADGSANEDSKTSGNASVAKTYMFDVSVSRLKTASTTQEEPPLVIMIYNISDHGQAQAMLSALAETQLELLSNIMPLHAIQFLALESREAIPANIGRLAHRHKNVTLLFMDICGFTTYSKSVEPESIMFLLNNLFSAFDQLTDECNVHKLETAGDCYLVSGGIMNPQPSASGFSTIIKEDEAPDPAESAKRVMEFAVRALKTAHVVMMPGTQSPVQMRVGIHTGDCVSGLIGSKLPKFSCFGDAMNVASRMESTGVPGRIHISETTYQLLRNKQWEWVPTGGVEVKGKGTMMTYLSQEHTSRQLEPPSLPPVMPAPGLVPCQYIKTAYTLLQKVAGPDSVQSLSGSQVRVRE